MVAWQLLLRQLCYKCCLLCTELCCVVDEVNNDVWMVLFYGNDKCPIIFPIYVVRVRWKNIIWGCMEAWVYSLMFHPFSLDLPCFAGTSSLLAWRVCTGGCPQAASPPEPQCWIWKHAAKASAGGTTVSWPRTTTWLLWPLLFVYSDRWVQKDVGVKLLHVQRTVSCVNGLCWKSDVTPLATDDSKEKK